MVKNKIIGLKEGFYVKLLLRSQQNNSSKIALQ